LKASVAWSDVLIGQDTLPEVAAICAAGGHVLELGCGAASGLLTSLVLYPRMTAVGADLNGLALEEARRRAAEVGDAREVREEVCYDLMFWSDHFFPSATRAATLAAAYRALRPGGYLFLSSLGEPPASAEALSQPSGRADALSRLLFSSWGVPIMDGRDAAAELEGAGFTVVRVLPSPADTLARAMLVQRPPVS